jgi:hypothetical protein
LEEVVKDFNYGILALDPGGTTGWAAYRALRITTDGPVEFYQEEWTCGQLGPEKHYRALETLLGNQRVTGYQVVCERFDDRPGGTFSVNLMAKEYIGVVETFCEAEQVEMFRQMPATAKKFVTNTALKNLGLWEGTKWKHAMDARRHLLWFLVNKEKRFDLLAKGWPNG